MNETAIRHEVSHYMLVFLMKSGRRSNCVSQPVDWSDFRADCCSCSRILTPLCFAQDTFIYVLSTMSDLAQIRRQLRIKSGVAQRLLKEHGLYIKEAEQLMSKRDKLVAESAESWDIGNATRMMEESNKMIKDTYSRSGRAVEELRDLVALANKVPELATDADLLKAQGILATADT